MESDIKQPYDDIGNEEIDITNENGDYTMDWTAPEEDVEQEQEQEEEVYEDQEQESEEYYEEDEYEQDEQPEEEDYALDEDEDDYGVELGQVHDDEEYDEDVEYDDDEYDYEDDEDDDFDDDYDEEWDKMFDFLDDHPGATPEDYIRMTSGIDDISDEEALKMRIASENGLDPSDDADEIDFLYDDTYAFDEDLDSERDIKLRQIAAKKDLREARETLEGLKDRYAADLTFNGNASPEVKEAVEFYEEYQDTQANNTELHEAFIEDTNDLFSDGFKGFEFEYGDGRTQRIRVNANQVAQEQSDISNFINKYTDENGNISDVQGYHKALWGANNIDAVFNHAYEQGKADAVRSGAKNAKNIDMGARQESDQSTGSQSRFKLENPEADAGWGWN